MTTAQIAQLAQNPNFVTSESPFKLGQEHATSGGWPDDNPFPKGKEHTRWDAGYYSVVNAVADAETAAYLEGGAI